MHLLRTSLAAVALIGGVTVATAQAPQSVSTTAAAGRAMAGKQLSPADSRDWKSIRSPVLSNDGNWFAYILAPNEGDANVVVRSTGDAGKELRFPIGEIPAPPTNPFSGGATTTALAISGDSKWVAFSIYPSQRDARRLRQQHRPSQNRVALVNVVTGQKTEFDKIRRFAFAGDKPQWIALYGYAPEALGTAQGGTPNGNIGGSGNGVASPTPRSESADLLLVALGDGAVINIGNVGDFGFDDSGAFLAYTIDARDQIGNGVQLRDLRTDVVRVLDSEPALYRRLTWSDSGPALTVLRGKADSAAKDTVYSVLAFSGIGTVSQKKTIFDAAGRADFPTGMRVSGDRAPRISEDFATVFFGIQQAKPKAAEPAMASRDGNAGTARPAVVQAGAPGEGGTRNQPRVNADDENPSLVLWHWKDPRLQSMQLVQEQQDKSFSYLGEYRLAENRFVRLADESLRSVTLLPHERYAYGVDTRDYDQRASYDGREYADVYLLDLKSGERKIASKKSLSFFSMPSPDGRELLYWGDDAHYYVLDAATGQKRNVTKDVAVSFANLEDDHNNIVAPPRRPFGWAKDASAVLLYDGWDVWKVPVRSGGKAVNLTIDGRKTQVHYQRLYAFEAPGSGGRRGRGSVAAGPGAAAVSDGVDLSKPLYFATYSEWTKKEGFARVDVSRPGATTLVADDASLNFLKAKDADLFVYTRQTSTDFPNYYIASADFKRGRPITDANPQQKEFAWSSGARLITYVSDRGDTLQGALYLPANYEPGRKYPLLVTIYEKRSQLLNTYVNPSETSTPNRSIYTSRGYAVLDPDIVYRVNDPGMSAVWCVLPSVRAAIATGIVDSAHIGLWGHSWGGYQTAFLVTQTNMFHAAVAGAPLTDMVSMYSSVYWNTGGANQAIFESSQGRFKGNFIQNYDAYIRNSPAFHADKVTTPLVILHNDKDGAVDFNQGITYYNTLRQLGKDVILLEYVGENHGLQRPVNQKDYAVRMREWFDFQLKGAPPADWITNGVPRLKMEDHLKDRREADKSIKADVVP